MRRLGTSGAEGRNSAFVKKRLVAKKAGRYTNDCSVPSRTGARSEGPRTCPEDHNWRPNKRQSEDLFAVLGPERKAAAAEVERRMWDLVPRAIQPTGDNPRGEP
jgi:hypothetical protein